MRLSTGWARNQGYRRRAGWLVVLCLWACVSGGTVVAASAPRLLNTQAALLLDPDGQAGIAEITQALREGRFNPLPRGETLFGFSDAAHWFRLPASVVPAAGGPWLLEVATPSLDRVDLYQRRADGGLATFAIGDMLPHDNRPVASRRLLFPVVGGALAGGDILVRVRSDGSIRVPLKLWHEQDFNAAEAVDLVWQAVYAGVFLAMILYNLILYLSARDRSYLHYVMFWSGFLVAHLTSQGVSQAVLWPSAAGLSNLVVVVALGWSVGWGARFVGHFLDLRNRAPRAALLFDAFTWLGLAGAVAGLMLPYGPMLKTLLVIAGLLVLACFITIPFVYAHGYRPARFLVAAILALLPGFGLVIAANIGWVPSTSSIERVIQISTMAEPFIFALALADRIKAIEAGAIVAERRARSLQERFSRALIARQEEVRRHIARSLHDSVGQGLLVAINRIGALRRRGEDGGDNGGLDDLEQIARETLDEVRGLSHDLHPHHLDQLGLDSALREMFDKVFRETGIEPSLDLAPVDDRLPRADAIHLFRLAQEAANNVVKHSGASRCDIRLDIDNDGLRFEVADDGRGLRDAGDGGAPRMNGRAGFGLAGMRERARMLGGNLELASAPGAGLRLSVRIPTDGKNMEEEPWHES